MSERIENDVVAVMRPENDAQEAVIDLERDGFERDGIRVIHPGEAREKIGARGEQPGMLARLARHLQGALSDEPSLLEEYEEAASTGAEVIAVHVERPEDLERVRDILLAHHGENIRHFGSWAVTDLQNQGRATS